MEAVKKESNVISMTPAVFTPSAVIECYNNALKLDLESSPILIKGIYQPDPNNKLYGGSYYDKLIEEGGKEILVLKTSVMQRDKLKGLRGKLVTVSGIITRKVRQDSTIAVSVTLNMIASAEESKVSDEELKTYELLRKKAEAGRKDVRMIIKQLIYAEQKPKIALMWAVSSIVKTEFMNALGNAGQHINFFDVDCPSFANTKNVISILKELDGKYDAIAMIRGGGSGLEAFNKIELLQQVAGMKSAVISAVGHAEEKHQLKNIADLTIDTPTAAGKFFSDTTEAVVEEKAKSKAALVEEVKKQFIEQLSNQDKQIKTQNEQNQNLQKQIKELTDISKQTSEKNSKIVDELQKQLKTVNDTSAKRDEESTKTINGLTEQISTINKNTQSQLEAFNVTLKEKNREIEQVRNENKGVSLKYAVAIAAASAFVGYALSLLF